MGIELEEVSRRALPGGVETLRSALRLEWIREALERTGKATLRRRKLPNEAVVWLVIGMALFTNRSVEAVVKHLGLATEEDWGDKRPRSATGSPVTSGGATRARARVGAEPLEELFDLTAAKWERETADLDVWRGLRLRALDGTTLRIADSPANEEVYGRPGSTRAPAAYPQARVVAVLGLGGRMMSDFVVGTYDQGEQTLAQLLYPRLADDTLVLLDRNFVNHAAFVRIPAEGRNRHFLCRGRESGMSFRTIGELGPGDFLIELRVPPHHRSKDRSLPETVVVRMLEYTIKGFGRRRLLTSLQDPRQYPAEEIIELYHRRWEIELAYGEIKTQTLERREALRSRDPELVRQEIWGLALAYNLMRVMMARAARTAEVPASRMSFRNSLLQIQTFLLMAWNDKPGTLPRLYQDLLDELALLVLPQRRARRYPRAVKIKMSNYNKAPQ
jgi:hypothetical protein